MATCETLLTTIDPACDALKRPGGVDARMWIGALSDLSGITFGTGNEVTAFTFEATKGLKKIISRSDKHNGTFALEAGENSNVVVQTMNIVAYAKLPAERAAIDQLLQVNDPDVFLVIETRGGQLEVWGVNKVGAFSNFGFRCTNTAGATGTVLNDSTATTINLEARLLNTPLVYKQAGTLAANIAELDALVV